LLKKGHGGQRRPVEWQDTTGQKQYGALTASQKAAAI
jgi:hypothetical protein